MRILAEEIIEQPPDLSEAEQDVIVAQLLTLRIAKLTISTEGGGLHYGPLAVEFAQMFGLGDDASRIRDIDVLGILLAAVKSLARRVEALENP